MKEICVIEEEVCLDENWKKFVSDNAESENQKKMFFRAKKRIVEKEIFKKRSIFDLNTILSEMPGKIKTIYIKALLRSFTIERKQAEKKINVSSCLYEQIKNTTSNRLFGLLVGEGDFSLDYMVESDIKYFEMEFSQIKKIIIFLESLLSKRKNNKIIL